MDPATLIGIAAAFGIILLANILEGGNPASLFLLPPMLLVFGATFMVTVAGGTLLDTKRALVALKIAFAGKPADPATSVPVIVALADRARKEGLLSLEDSVKDIDDEFLARGVTLAVDGTDPEELREILEGEAATRKRDAKGAAKFYADMGAYAPTIGIVGTVMSLVHVLENLANPEELGHMIAAAFLATLWGVCSANVMWLPIAARLKRFADLDEVRTDVAVEGVLAIQAGANPRLVAQRLRAMLSAEQRAKLEAA